jgi:four helix bundle protein
VGRKTPVTDGRSRSRTVAVGHGYVRVGHGRSRMVRPRFQVHVFGRRRSGRPRDSVHAGEDSATSFEQDHKQSAMHPHERLRAWQLCDQLAVDVYRVTESFPKREWYGLASQARRAAFSAAANIVEGSVKRGSREFRRFLDMSLGSLAELSYILKLSGRLGYIDDQDAIALEQARRMASIVTWRLYDGVRRRADALARPIRSADQ